MIHSVLRELSDGRRAELSIWEFNDAIENMKIIRFSDVRWDEEDEEENKSSKKKPFYWHFIWLWFILHVSFLLILNMFNLQSLLLLSARRWFSTFACLPLPTIIYLLTIRLRFLSSIFFSIPFLPTNFWFDIGERSSIRAFFRSLGSQWFMKRKFRE